MISGDIKPGDTLDPEDIEAMHAHISDFLLEERERTSGEPDELRFLEDTGYPTTVPEEGSVAAVPEQQVHAAEASGQLLLMYETGAGSESDASETSGTTPAPPQAEPPRTTTPPSKPRGWQRPKARTPGQKAARDSRPDLKPWPYGSRED